MFTRFMPHICPAGRGSPPHCSRFAAPKQSIYRERQRLFRFRLLPVATPLPFQDTSSIQRARVEASAYLKATGSSLADFQQIYQQRRAQLLNIRRGADHPEPVATTWDISFRKVEEENPAATDQIQLKASIISRCSTMSKKDMRKPSPCLCALYWGGAFKSTKALGVANHFPQSFSLPFTDQRHVTDPRKARR